MEDVTVCPNKTVGIMKVLYDVLSRKIRLIESIAKCRYLKTLTSKETLRQVFICLRTPPPTLLGFSLG
jgi:hypothetical protein